MSGDELRTARVLRREDPMRVAETQDVTAIILWGVIALIAIIPTIL